MPQQASNDRELRLLLLAVQPASAAAEAALRQELEQPFDGDRLVETACRQEVHPLLARALKDQLWSRGEPWEEKLASACRQSLARNIFLDQELARVVSILSRSGIQVIPIKGPGLAERLYGGLDMRTSGDLDLCVRGRDAVEAVELIRGAGYRSCLPLSRGDIPRFLPFDKSVDLVLTEGPVPIFIDLHWDIAASEQMIRVDLDGVWARAATAGGNGGRRPALASEDVLLFLALHGYNHGWDILKLVCDVDRVVRTFSGSLDWQAVSGRARSWMMSDILERALRLAQRLLGTPLPAEAAGCLAGGYWREDPIAEPGTFIAGTPERGRAETAAAAWLSRLRDRRGASHRARLLVGSFHPRSMDFFSLPEGSRSPWMAWLLRPFRIAGKVAGEAMSARQSGRTDSGARPRSADKLGVKVKKTPDARRG